MEELESNVDEMESDRVSLEELITGYEKGTKLLKLCQDRIAEAQKRIEKIAKEAGDGEFSLAEFDPEEADESVAEVEEEEEEEGDEVRLL